MHAAHLWQVEHREIFEKWWRESNTVVIVSVRDVGALESVLARARSASVPASAFYDEDVAPRLTALALGPDPSDAARKLCSQLPKAMKEVPAED